MNRAYRRVSALFAALLILVPASLPMLSLASAQATTPACGTADAPVDIALSSPVSGRDASPSSDDDCYFRVALAGDLASQRLRVNLSLAGDHHVYVKRGAAPTLSTSSNDCFGTTSSPASEWCIVDWPLSAGDHIIRVARVDAAASDFTLVATLEQAAPGCNLGAVITSVTASQAYTLDGATGSKCLFAYTATHAGELVKFNLAAAATTTYLYVRAGALPITSHMSTSAVADCIATSGTTNRNCIVPAVAGQTYYGMVYRFSAGTSGSSTLTTTTFNYCSLGPGVTTLSEGSPVSGSFTLDAGAHCDFAFTPAAGFSLANISASVSSTSGSPFLLLKRGALPTTTPLAINRDCSASATTAGVSCTLRHEGGVVYASVWRTATGSGTTTFTITARSAEGCSAGAGEVDLADDVASFASLANLSDAACHFRFTPSPDEANVRVVAQPTAGDVDLYVRKGARATLAAFDCKADAGGAGIAETCELENDGSDLSVMVWRKAGAPSFGVTAHAFSPCSLGGGSVALTLGSPLEGELTDAEGATCWFTVALPGGGADAVRLALVPESGDFDLYVRKGSRPSLAASDCSSTATGDALPEACAVALEAGTYHAAVRRKSGSGAFSVVATAVPSCEQGVGVHALPNGSMVAMSLLDAPGAKCLFSFTPGHPLADPFHPANDMMRLQLAPATGNFDLYVRKNALPTTTTRDCASTLAGAAAESCELLVSDGATYYGMVRRASGSGAFHLLASTSSSCALGPGMHRLVDRIDPGAAFRNVTSAACYFRLDTSPSADLAQFDLAVAPGPSSSFVSATLSVAQGYVPSVAARDCGGNATFTNYPSLGLVLNSPAQCALPVAASAPWYVRIAQGATLGTTTVTPALVGETFFVPTLENGVPAQGSVRVGGTQYWKVIVPQDATMLSIETSGDPTGTACQAGSQAGTPAGGNVALACALMALPSLVGCVVLAGQGLPASCSDLDRSFVQRCDRSDAPDEACRELATAARAACLTLEALEPAACDKLDGSYTGTCRLAASRDAPARCPGSPLDLATVRPIDVDLYVRRTLLPSPALNDCASKNGGSFEACRFGQTAMDAHAQLQDARLAANAALADARRAVNENRTAADAAYAQARAAAGEGAPLPDLPATPGPQAPSPYGTAKPLPGGGKYYIAVKGPALELLTRGGDYAIVAVHDGSVGGVP
ncbi:MAG TPA: PPC domain-containing protein [Candidatus Thermoplasmatota archaeon]|nr:PPC domain-containing protein [Candidatus Thermoplasmatota archaeon]